MICETAVVSFNLEQLRQVEQLPKHDWADALRLLCYSTVGH